MKTLFAKKLHTIIESNIYRNDLMWSSSGGSFIIINKKTFCENVLPQIVKSSNYDSFQRQLNAYDFRKLDRQKRGIHVAKKNKNSFAEEEDVAPKEYYNEFFKRGRPDLLCKIKKRLNGKQIQRLVHSNVEDDVPILTTQSPPSNVLDLDLHWPNSEGGRRRKEMENALATENVVIGNHKQMEKMIDEITGQLHILSEEVGRISCKIDKHNVSDGRSVSDN